MYICVCVLCMFGMVCGHVGVCGPIRCVFYGRVYRP